MSSTDNGAANPANKETKQLFLRTGRFTNLIQEAFKSLSRDTNVNLNKDGSITTVIEDEGGSIHTTIFPNLPYSDEDVMLSEVEFRNRGDEIMELIKEYRSGKVEVIGINSGVPLSITAAGQLNTLE